MNFFVHPELHALVVHSLDDLTQKIPEARPLEIPNYYGVTHLIEPAQKLRALGYQVPSPIGYYYHWPKVMSLHEASAHQRATAGFLTLHKRAYNLSQIGTRKTSSALYAADYLLREKAIRRVLVVAPLSTLDLAWADTVNFTFNDRSIAVLHGTAAYRRRLFEKEFDFYVINHDALDIITERKYDKRGRLVSAELMRKDVDLIIIDEIAEFRNGGTSKQAVMQKLVQPEHWVWGLTGTPTPQAPSDAWAQARIITPERVPRYFSMFRQATMMQVTQYRWEPRKEATQIVFETLQPAIRFARKDVIPIDEPNYSTRTCELSDEQKKHYKEMMNTFVTELAEGERVLARNEGIKQSKLLQIACGSVYTKDGETVHIDTTPRIKLTKEIITQAGQKVIVFVPFTHVLHRLSEELANHWSVEIIHGGVSKGARDDIFTRFQKSKDPHVLVADPGCMPHGLTLTAANTIVWYGPKPSNNIYTQASGRITRDGQEGTPYIINIAATPAERIVYRRLQNQESLQGAFLEMVKASMGQ